MSLFKNAIQRGTRAAQPAATAVVIGTLYYVTDESLSERSNGTIWQSYSQTGAGTGDVVGPSSSVASEVVLYDGTTGKLIKRATGTGIARVTSGVWGTPGNVVESEITLADNTTNNASAAAHGFVPKWPNNTTTFFRGDGTYAAPPPGGLVLIEEHTAATSSALDFLTRNKNGYTGATFQSDFDWYEVHFLNIVPASSGHLEMRFSTDGSTFDTGSNYDFSAEVINTGDAEDHASVSTPATTFFLIMPDIHATSSSGGFNGKVEIINPLNASQHKGYISRGMARLADGQTYTLTGSGRYLSTTAVVGARFFHPSINMASGVIRIYGVAK